MNPGMFGAVSAVVNQKREVKNYKNEYTKCFSKRETKFIWNTRMQDLKERGLKFQATYDLLKQTYKDSDYFYIKLFEAVQNYCSNIEDIQHFVCYGDDDFELYEKQIYEKLKEKYKE